MEFLVNIDEGRRRRAARADGKTHSVGLAFPVVRILSQYDHTNISERRFMQRIEQILRRRVNRIGPVLVLNKGKQVFIIWF